MFFYWQQAGGEDAWQEALASARSSIIANKKPRYVTVLDLSELVHDSMTREQIAAIKYVGPSYFDWDAPELEATIAKVNQFRERLVELGVNQEAVRWYATGGRGFHAELPMELFVAKVNKSGYTNLPQIYREVAFELFTDTMDMRVYSARRGRMWRTPNVERENGRFKVPLSVQELSSITPESYLILTSTPREAPPLAPPEFNHELGLIFEKARLKVEDGAKKRKAGAKDLELLKRFRGDFPPTLVRIMQGEGLKEGTGFHQVAMQVAITANAIGKKDEDVLAACEGLIERHVSDGYRYNTPKKRRAELQRLLDYTRDNVCYGYSTGALKVLCSPDNDTGDLDGLPPEAGNRVDAEGDAELLDAGSLDLRGGLEMRENGIYKKDQENGMQMISDISFKNVEVLMTMPEFNKPAETIGYEVDVFLKGEFRGRQQLDTTTFLSKQRYQEFAMRNMGVIRGSDNDVASLKTIVRDMGMKSGGVNFVLTREGLDYVSRPHANPPVKDLVWVQTSGVYSAVDAPYIFRATVTGAEGNFKSNLWDAPLLTGSEDEKTYFRALLSINDPTTLAPMLGWFTACFHRMVYDHLYMKFPLCQVWGEPGSGKTETTRLLARMHYYGGDPVTIAVNSPTQYYLKMCASLSSSIPLILDEYKPAEMPVRMKELLPNLFRSTYNRQSFGSGGGDERPNQSWKSLTKIDYTSPIIFLAERIEPETAIMERTISVPVNKVGLAGKKMQWKLANDRKDLLASLGKSIVSASFGLDPQALKDMTDANVEDAEKLLKADTQQRVAYNFGVVLTGFDFLTQVMRHYFKSDLDAELARLREAILLQPAEVAGAIMGEASKTLNDIAFMSKTEDSFSSFSIKEGVDYCFTTVGGEPCVDLKMQNCFVKYSAWAKAKNQVALYQNYEAFVHGLAYYSATINKVCMDSPLKDGGLAKVYRFSLVKLTEQGVQDFKKS